MTGALHIAEGLSLPREHAAYILERLHSHSDDGPGGCWLWRGYLKNGYGAMSVGNVDRYVHRLSFEIHHGPIPEGLFVCHRCDVKPCWHPAHLFAGTQVDNMQDAKAKGRHVPPPPPLPGAANQLATLSDEDVASIRSLAGSYQQREIATAFGVSQSTVWRLIHREVRA